MSLEPGAGHSPAAPRESVPAEIRSTLALLDYYRLWYRHRRLFFAGLLAVIVLGLAGVSFKQKQYKAHATIFISDRVRPENLVQLEKLMEVTANEQYRSAVNGVLADQYLQSNELLLEAAQALASGSDGGTPVDLYALLKVNEKDEAVRRLTLANQLKRNVVEYAPIQNSGAFEISAELPDAYVAARFVNLCVEQLKQRFVNLYFAGYDKALDVTQRQYETELAERGERAGELSYGDTVDQRPAVAQKAERVDAYMRQQAQRLATMADKIQGLRVITDPTVKEAAQPVNVVARAEPPLTHSRPKRSITMVLLCLIYTFVFMLGLMFRGYAQAALRQMEAERPADRPATPPREAPTIETPR